MARLPGMGLPRNFGAAPRTTPVEAASTTSGRSEVRYMETRIFWTDQVDLDNLAERSARAVAAEQFEAVF